MKKNIVSILIGSVIGIALGVTALHNQEPTIVYATSAINWEAQEANQESESVTEPRHLTYAEKLIIAACVYAEANTEDLTGKRLVVDVILNRVDSQEFPNCVAQVVYEPYQFWVDGMPNDYSVIPEDCFTAIELELRHQLNTEVLYFRTGRYHNFGTAVLQHGAHYFSK